MGRADHRLGSADGRKWPPFALTPARLSAIRAILLKNKVKKSSGNRYTIALTRARITADVTAAGLGLGGQFRAAAALRCLRIASEAGSVLPIIDAKGERAAIGTSHSKTRPLLALL
jgi:hypothetical protein